MRRELPIHAIVNPPDKQSSNNNWVLTGPYPMLQFGGACGLGVGAFYQSVVCPLPQCTVYLKFPTILMDFFTPRIILLGSL